MSGPTLSLLFSLLNVLLAPLRERLLDNRVNVELLKDQEQQLVRKETDRRPQRNRSNHRYREHDLLDGLGSVAVSLDAPPMILLSRQVPINVQHSTFSTCRDQSSENGRLGQLFELIDCWIDWTYCDFESREQCSDTLQTFQQYGL